MEATGAGGRAERARFATGVITSALAPTNFLAGNPAALKRTLETGGSSLVQGGKHWVSDLRHIGGKPSTAKQGTQGERGPDAHAGRGHRQRRPRRAAGTPRSPRPFVSDRCSWLMTLTGRDPNLGAEEGDGRTSSCILLLMASVVGPALASAHGQGTSLLSVVPMVSTAALLATIATSIATCQPERPTPQSCSSSGGSGDDDLPVHVGVLALVVASGQAATAASPRPSTGPP